MPDDLRKAVERLHGCRAVHVDETALIERYGGEMVWSGVVHTFRLKGCPQADLAYAWASPTDSGKVKYYAVLAIPPIDSPQAAVRASIVKDYRDRAKSGS